MSFDFHFKVTASAATYRYFHNYTVTECDRMWQNVTVGLPSLCNHLFLPPLCCACWASVQLEVHSVQRGSAAIRHRALQRLGCTHTTNTGSRCTKQGLGFWQRKGSTTEPCQRKRFTICVFFLPYVALMRMNGQYFLRRNEQYFLFSSIFFCVEGHVYSVILHFCNNTN